MAQMQTMKTKTMKTLLGLLWARRQKISMQFFSISSQLQIKLPSIYNLLFSVSIRNKTTSQLAKPHLHKFFEFFVKW